MAADKADSFHQLILILNFRRPLRPAASLRFKPELARYIRVRVLCPEEGSPPFCIMRGAQREEVSMQKWSQRIRPVALALRIRCRSPTKVPPSPLPPLPSLPGLPGAGPALSLQSLFDQADESLLRSTAPPEPPSPRTPAHSPRKLGDGSPTDLAAPAMLSRGGGVREVRSGTQLRCTVRNLWSFA